jgi:putative drug exporter of the RND superfamily
VRDSTLEQSRWTRSVAGWSVAHRWIVVSGWLLLTVVGMLSVARSSSRLSFTFDLPGQPAFETNTDIVRQFGNGGDNPPLVAVVQLPAGVTVDSPGVRAELDQSFQVASTAVPHTRAASWVSTGSRAFVSADSRTTFALLYPPIDFTNSDPYASALPLVEKAVTGARVNGQPVRITGASILSSGGQGGSGSVLLETLLAGIGALVVLAIVFGSVLALLPLVIAVIAIPTTFIGIYALTYVTTMSTLVQNIVALIGLGVAIDYALLICTRWREERQQQASNREAVLAAAATAGGSVLFSGIVVTVSLAALALTSVPFLRSIGLAGLLIPLVSIAVSATLLPVLLDGLDRKLDWPRKKPAHTVSRLWTRIAGQVVRHRVAAAIGSTLLLLVLAAPVITLRLGEPQANATAGTAPTEARLGYQALADSGIGAGALRPIELLSSQPLGRLAGLPPAAQQIAPDTWASGSSRVTNVWSPADPASDEGAQLLSAVRQSIRGRATVRVGGTLAQDNDFIHALYGRNLVLILCAIVLVTFVLLARALRSLWLPVKALLLNAISLIAAFGVLTFVWQQGHATQALFSSPATGAVTLWVPLAVFALLFGLSMDYEVFILTRINEEYARDGDTNAATVRAIGHTGRLVSSGALILFLAFVALGGVPVTDVKILSTGLAVGVIVDATIIRGILAPALVALLGHYNWVMPDAVGRLLRIKPLVPGQPERDRR